MAIIAASFNIDKAVAEEMLGQVGQGFSSAAPPEKPVKEPEKQPDPPPAE